MLLLHPELLDRPCSDCTRHLYLDRGPGQFGPRLERPRGKPVPRPKGTRPPCEWCPKVPRGDPPRPESAQELSPKNLQALLFHRQCRAVGRFPDDAIVRRNAALVDQIERDAAEIRQATAQLQLFARMGAP